MPRKPAESTAFAKFGPDHSPVYVYAPREGAKRERWNVYWNSPDGPQRRQRVAKKDALKLAEDIGRQLKRSRPGSIVSAITPEHQQLLELCGQLDHPRQVLLDAIEKQRLTAKRVSVAELCERWRVHHENSPIATRKSVQRRTKVIEATLGDRFADALSFAIIRDWQTSTLTGSNRHRNNHLAELRTLLNFAAKAELLPDGFNPARKVPMLKTDKAEPSTWTPETLRLVLGHAREKLVPFVALGAFAGMRPSEIAGVVGERDGLQWEDIDFSRRHIRIRPEVAGKTGAPRYIEFTENKEAGFSEELANALWATLVSWLQPYRILNGPVAPRKSAEYISRELRAAKIIEEWPADVLRHSFISYLLALTPNKHFVAKQAGNSPEIIEKNYLAPTPKPLGEAWFAVRNEECPEIQTVQFADQASA